MSGGVANVSLRPRHITPDCTHAHASRVVATTACNLQYVKIQHSRGVFMQLVTTDAGEGLAVVSHHVHTEVLRSWCLDQAPLFVDDVV